MIENDKTEAHMFFNASKGGINAFDGMCENLSYVRKTRRWPLYIFYTLLNIVMNNNWILYAVRPQQQGTYKTRLTSSLKWVTIFVGLWLLRIIRKLRNLTQTVRK